MCSAGHDLRPEVRAALADVLREIAVALSPDDPGAVRIGPVDFGSPLLPPLRPGPRPLRSRRPLSPHWTYGGE